MTAQEEGHVVFMGIGQNLISQYNIKDIMKKRLSSCTDCADDTSILTQVSSGPEVILLCSDCYNLKYSKEIQNEISYYEKKKK